MRPGGDYNHGFVKRFQPALQANERAVADLFERRFEAGSVARKDAFMTGAVNAISNGAFSEGTAFCPRGGQIIEAMKAVPSPEALPDFAAGMTPQAPLNLCAAVAPAARP